jgi:hypothetical protein
VVEVGAEDIGEQSRRFRIETLPMSSAFMLGGARPSLSPRYDVNERPGDNAPGREVQGLPRMSAIRATAEVIDLIRRKVTDARRLSNMDRKCRRDTAGVLSWRCERAGELQSGTSRTGAHRLRPYCHSVDIPPTTTRSHGPAIAWAQWGLTGPCTGRLLGVRGPIETSTAKPVSRLARAVRPTALQGS